MTPARGGWRRPPPGCGLPTGWTGEPVREAEVALVSACRKGQEGFWLGHKVHGTRDPRRMGWVAGGRQRRHATTAQARRTAFLNCSTCISYPQSPHHHHVLLLRILRGATQYTMRSPAPHLGQATGISTMRQKRPPAFNTRDGIPPTRRSPCPSSQGGRRTCRTPRGRRASGPWRCRTAGIRAHAPSPRRRRRSRPAGPWRRAVPGVDLVQNRAVWELCTNPYLCSLPNVPYGNTGGESSDGTLQLDDSSHISASLKRCCVISGFPAPVSIAPAGAAFAMTHALKTYSTRSTAVAHQGFCCGSWPLPLPSCDTWPLCPTWTSMRRDLSRAW